MILGTMFELLVLALVSVCYAILCVMMTMVFVYETIVNCIKWSWLKCQKDM